MKDVANLVDQKGKIVGIISRDSKVLSQNGEVIGIVNAEGKLENSNGHKLLVNNDAGENNQPLKVEFPQVRAYRMPDYRQVTLCSRGWINLFLRLVYNLLRFIIVVVQFYFLPILIIFIQFWLMSMNKTAPDPGESEADLFTPIIQ